MSLLKNILQAEIPFKGQITEIDYDRMQNINDRFLGSIEDLTAFDKHLKTMKHYNEKHLPEYNYPGLVKLEFGYTEYQAYLAKLDTYVNTVSDIQKHFNTCYSLEIDLMGKFKRPIRRNYEDRKHYSNPDNKYNFENYGAKDIFSIKDAWEVLGIYLNELGGVSLVQSAKRKVIDDFKGRFYRKDNVQQKGKSIKFTNYMFTYEYDWGETQATIKTYYSHGDRGTALEKLYLALSLFETGEVKDLLGSSLPYKHGDKIVFGKEDIEDFKKVTSITYFKNQSAKVVFASEKDAVDFMIYFKLNTLPTK